jgi:hypothetical protein
MKHESVVMSTTAVFFNGGRKHVLLQGHVGEIRDKGRASSSHDSTELIRSGSLDADVELEKCAFLRVGIEMLSVHGEPR